MKKDKITHFINRFKKSKWLFIPLLVVFLFVLGFGLYVFLSESKEAVAETVSTLITILFRLTTLMIIIIVIISYFPDPKEEDEEDDVL